MSNSEDETTAKARRAGGTDPAESAPSLPLYKTELPDYEATNKRLKATLLAMAENVPDVVTNSAYGRSYFENKWLSDSTLRQNPDPDIQAIVRYIESLANRLASAAGATPDMAIHSMWCIVGRKGLTGRAHSHKGKLSGAYYVDAGNPGDDGGGDFHILTPDGRPYVPAKSVRPRSGMILLFPSSLMHSVTPYMGSEPRIVISYNLE